MNRREALQTAGAVLAASTMANQAAGIEQPKAKRTTIAMLLYPQFTALDLVGPHHVFSTLRGFKVELVWKTTDSVTSDLGLTVKPTMTLKDCPEELAVLFVPGGTTGTVKMMGDADILGFLKARGDKSDYVTSVCTGSLVLGAAGLLRGYKATTHWVALDVLKTLGAEPVKERVVQDRNRFTGGGVTAGIDFALSLAAKLKDETTAKRAQLIMEYAPAPPFKSGTPAEAGEELAKATQTLFTPFTKAATAAAEKAKAGW